MTATAPPKPNAPPGKGAPVTQEKTGFRQNWPAWLKQFPQWNFPPPDPHFVIIKPEDVDKILGGKDPKAAVQIKEEIAFLDKELTRLFRERDYQAKYQQNRYRVIQIAYLVLATLATFIGSLLALVLNSAPQLVPWLAFGETIIALLTTYLATVSGREPPLPLWLENRRKAEHLRREYFRYLMNLSPYDELEGFRRRQTLSERAANINRGFFPEVDTAPGAAPGAQG